MIIKFKCRMCGEIHNDACVGEKMCALGLQIAMHSDMADQWNAIIGAPPAMTTLLHCKDGSYGVADLIGAKQK